MKRTLIILSALTLAAVSCQKSVDCPTAVDATLVADASGATKTALSGKSVEWLAGDAIAVFPDGGSLRQFTTEAAGKTASFTGQLPYGSKEVLAVYPYADGLNYNDGTVTMTLPSSQTAVAGGFADDLAIIVASATLAEDYSAKLSFKQVCGLVKVTVGGDDIESISLKAADGTALAGSAKVSADASIAPTAATSSLTLTPASGSLIAKGDYYFTAYPSSLEGASLVYKTTTSTKTKTLTGLKVERAVVTVIDGSDADMKPDDWVDPSTVVKANGVQLTQNGTKIYEGTIDVPASCEFTISVGTDEYGFASYSGAGGVGACRNDNSSFPCYNFSSAYTTKTDLYYNVSRATGQMAKIADGGNKFFTALPAASKLFVRVDMTGSAYTYYFKVVSDDPSVVFHEDFDLCTYGGDYMIAIPGTKDAKMDGMTPGTKAGSTANTPSFVFDYPTKVAASGGVASDAYIASRGLEGWEFEYAGERPGAMQLCAASTPGHMTTPKFTSLTSATDVTITIDVARFSTSSVDPITVYILGAGSFTSGRVEIEAYAAAGTSAASKDLTVSGSSYAIVDDAYCPHTLGNSDKDKPHSVFTFKASGLTADSQIKIDAPKGAKNAPRCFIFDIKVTK